jgi:hypothetical protein
MRGPFSMAAANQDEPAWSNGLKRFRVRNMARQMAAL